eukprot:PhM_4_TR5718/c0_g1_i1/m.42269/K05768/GSN; gelsolin
MSRQKLDISETNLALLGSELEKKTKLVAANLEPAWNGVGQEPGLVIWRIEQFKVVLWPKEEHGNFYDGDSYIVLYTRKDPKGDKLLWDIFFWLGAYTTQDEAGTAAYKSVELDDVLGGSPVQHREVQGFESAAFLKCLPNSKLTVMNGGVDSGFRHVVADGPMKPRLYHVHGPSIKTVCVEELEMVAVASLSEADAYILHTEGVVYCFQGSACSRGEAAKASTAANELAQSGKRAAKVLVVTTADAPEEFWSALGGKAEVPAEPTTLVKQTPPAHPRLYHVSDASGEMKFDLVAEGAEALKAAALDSGDCFVLLEGETGAATVWVGRGSNANEARTAWFQTQSLLTSQGVPMAPLQKIREGEEPQSFRERVTLPA